MASWRAMGFFGTERLSVKSRLRTGAIKRSVPKGHVLGHRIALQAIRAGSVTPALHQ